MQPRTARSAAPQPERLKHVSGGETNKSLPMKKPTPPRSMAGFLLTDSLLSPISFNAEAVQILSFPEKVPDSTRLPAWLTEKIRSALMSRRPSGESPFVAEFRSGRRRYFCRTFFVNSGAQEPSQPSIALLLERGPSGLVPLSQISEQFNLTQREGEVLEYLLQGMSSKVIANRMNLSPNTVKAFLRLIMIKTGVSSRAAIVGKMIMTQPQ
jgi:DNA-binding CsgD family transcriptional regulator